MEATTAQNNVLPLSTRIDLARNSKRDLARWIGRFDRWMAACDLLAAGDDSQWRRMRPPSKNSKHQAYGSAGHMLRCLPELTVDAPAHPSTVDELRLVVSAFEGRYGK